MKQINFSQLLNKPLFWLVMITLIAGWFRIWRLSEHPVSLSLDEVIVGYDAYSILHTGKDHHGHFLPLVFESIGDYKSPVLIYSIIPAIMIWGLTEFGVRITVAVIGTLTIVTVYYLVKELLSGNKLKASQTELIALITAFSLAISPWHIVVSRFSHDVVLAVFFLIIAITLLLWSLRTKSKTIWLAFLFFVLSAYSYHALKLIAPLMLGGLIIIFRQSLLRFKKQLAIGMVAAAVYSFPMLYLMTTESGQHRAKVTSLIRDVEISQEIQVAGDNTGLISNIFNHQGLILVNFWAKRFLDYWDINYLFFYGLDITLADRADVGLMHQVELPFFLLGLWQVFWHCKKYFEPHRFKFVCFWLIIGPLAASLANNAQHPFRSLNWIPVPQLLVASGAVWFIRWLQDKKLIIKLGAIFIISFWLLYSLLYFMDIYWHHSPIQQSEYWQYGMKQFTQYAIQNYDKYDEVVIDTVLGSAGPNTVGIPYAYVLFYGSYDPKEFQIDERRQAVNFESINFANYTFRSIYWPEDRKSKNKLFIGSPWSLPLTDLQENQILKKIYFKNGVLGFLIVETK